MEDIRTKNLERVKLLVDLEVENGLIYSLVHDIKIIPCENSDNMFYKIMYYYSKGDEQIEKIDLRKVIYNPNTNSLGYTRMGLSMRVEDVPSIISTIMDLLNLAE